MADNSIPYALVAEDDVIIRMDAVGILESAGFRVKEAGDVEEALGLLNDDADRFSLLFTDVQSRQVSRLVLISRAIVQNIGLTYEF